MKKKSFIVGIGVILIVAIVCGGIYFTRNRVVTDISQYGRWDKDIDSGLKIFPEKIAGKAETDYSYKRTRGILDNRYEIYLECRYEQDEFQTEVERLKEIEDSYQEQSHEIKYDDTNFKYPAYVAIYDFDGDYEYALVDKEEERIYYIYMQKADREKISWDKTLLPNKDTIPKSDELRYNIYAYELETEDGWYINK